MSSQLAALAPGADSGDNRLMSDPVRGQPQYEAGQAVEGGLPGGAGTGGRLSRRITVIVRLQLGAPVRGRSR